MVNGAFYTETVAGDNEGTWEAEITLAEGANVLVVMAQDRAGNVSLPAEPRTLTLDQTPPELSAGLTPAWQKPGQPVTITAVVTEPGELYHNYVWVEVAGPDPATHLNLDDLRPGPWRTTFTGGLEGFYDASVKARDKAGNVAESPILPLILDGTPPALTFTLATSSSYGSLTGTTVYYNSQGSGGFTVTAVLSDALAGLEVVTFPATVAPGASYLLNGATSATLSQVYLFDSGSSFSNTVEFEASDRAGNGVTQTFRVFQDVLPPVLVVTVPLTVPLHFRVAWGAADGGSGLRHYDVQYQAGPLGSWQGWLTETLETSAYFLGEAGQSYSFKVSATDKVNNTAIEEVGPVTVQSVTKYYSLGDQRVAMRQGSEVYYLHGDHLGSTSLTTDQNGVKYSESRYRPYGEERWTSGETPTDFQFTGQRSEAGFGLIDFNARYYSPALGRFVSADTVVPEPTDSQIFNRYTYVGNNPILNTDPDGHCYPVCTVALGATIGAVVGVGLYAANVARSGQDWSWSEAGVAATGGAIAGGLIGTGVGIAAGASALAITGAGVGMAGAGGGYMAANIVTQNEFKSTDFAITAGIGAGTGAIAPFAATTLPSAMALNGAANALTYEATTYANTGSLAFDEGLAWSTGTGVVAGFIAGPATPLNKITIEGTDEYAKQFGQAYGNKVSGSSGISFDPTLFPDQVSKGIWRETKAGAGRTLGSGIVTNYPCQEDVCQ